MDRKTKAAVGDVIIVELGCENNGTEEYKDREILPGKTQLPMDGNWGTKTRLMRICEGAQNNISFSRRPKIVQSMQLVLHAI